MTPSNQSNQSNQSKSKPYTFNSKEKMTISNEKVEFGDMVYNNTFISIISALNWKDHYFTLERSIFGTPPLEVCIGEFYEYSHKNYGFTPMITSSSSEEERKDFLIEFFKKWIKDERQK